jgi:hypothetical protein
VSALDVDSWLSTPSAFLEIFLRRCRESRIMDSLNPKAPLIVDDSVNSMVKAVHRNVDQEFLFTTIDKVRICLMTVLSDMQNARAWTTPLGILVTLAVVFPTTSFREWLSVKAEIWQAFFYFGTVGVTVWFIRGLFKARKAPTVNLVIEMLKKDSLQPAEASHTGSAPVLPST